MSKRDVSNETLADKNAVQETKKDQALSDNISLFQSLRVLQEGEGEDSTTTEVNSNKKGLQFNNFYM